jgi:hypothetical protein
MSKYHDHRSDCPFKFAPLDVCDCAEHNMLDHIEQLVVTNKSLIKELKTCRMAQAVMDNTVAYLERERDEANEVIDKQGALLADAYGAYLDWDEVLKDRADHECKAKLVKAVEALRDMCAEFRGHDLPYGSKAYLKATITLAEIEGSDAP